MLERWLLSLLDTAVFVHFAIVVSALHSRPSERNQIWHTYSDRYGTDSNLKKVDPPDPRGVPGGILAGQQLKSPGNVMNCPENQYFFFKQKPHPTPGGPSGNFRGSTIQKSGKYHGLPRKKLTICFNPHSTLWLGVLGLKMSNQKSRKFHELPRKWFHFKPLTPPTREGQF